MMGSHASQINYAERWAVIHYVQKLRAEGLGTSAPADSLAKSTTDTTAAAAVAKK
jgi:hypothetical protein